MKPSARMHLAAGCCSFCCQEPCLDNAALLATGRSSLPPDHGPACHIQPKGSTKAEGRVYVEVVEGYFARHKVKPGITGWAQIRGWRGETDTVEKIEQRVAHDLHYIENWSAWLDLKILLMTPVSLVMGKNAY